MAPVLTGIPASGESLFGESSVGTSGFFHPPSWGWRVKEAKEGIPVKAYHVVCYGGLPRVTVGGGRLN